MEIEYEATFININREEIIEKLKNAGAKLIKPEFLQKRSVFDLPKGHEIPGGWARVRDEKDKITMSLKIVDGEKIENQKELCLTVNNFKDAEEFLIQIGCRKKAYQENKRELWILDEVEITIDEWPFLDPFIEIEGKTEKEVKAVTEKLGLDYADALFCCVDVIYSKKYNISKDVVNNQTPEILFGENNPFI
jgi:adenylate cyclase class 2